MGKDFYTVVHTFKG